MQPNYVIHDSLQDLLLRQPWRRDLSHIPSLPQGLLFVEVEASVTKPERLDIASTNTFKFVFTSNNMARPIKRVLPTTEEEAQRAYECCQAADKLIPLL